MANNRVKLDQLTSIRGIAAWWVVLFHSQAFLSSSLPAPLLKIIAHGYLAVDLFFILSGFVIYFNYHAKLISGFPKSAIPFYLNRLSRIYPVHFLMLGGYLFLAAAFLYFSKSGTLPETYNTKSFMESILLVHAWFGTGVSWNVPSWSISAEWFVYLLFPLMAIILQKHCKNLFTHYALSVIFLGSIYWVYSAMGVSSLGDDTFTMALIRTFFEFILGAIVGSFYINYHSHLVRYKYWMLFALAGTLLLYFNFNLKDYMLIPGAFFFLIAFMCVDDGLTQNALTNKVLIYLGEISYSTYMIHYFVYDLLKAGWVTHDGKVNQVYLFLSFFVVLLGSALMHRFVEMPSQKYLRNKLMPL